MGVGLALRCLWALVIPVAPVSDSAMYDAFARSIAEGRGYAYPEGQLTAFWPVGTSAVYAASYALFGHSWTPLVVLNVGLGTCLIWLTSRLAECSFGPRCGGVAAWVIALWPLWVQFTTVLASELLFTVLLMAALLAWTRSTLHWALRALLWSACLSAAMYVRPTVLPLFFVLPALDWWRDRNVRRALSSLAVALATAAVLIGPWALRNQQLFGKPVLVSTNFGANLWMGNNPASDGAYMPLLANAPVNEVEQDAWYRRMATAYIADNPLRYAELTLRRFFITFSRETIGVVWNDVGLTRAGLAWAIPSLKLLSTFYWWAVASSAIAGVVIAWRRRAVDLANPLVQTAALLVAVPLLTVGQDRYHVPLDPILSAFAALAGVALMRRNEASSPLETSR
jgi:hypothetical protein